MQRIYRLIIAVVLLASNQLAVAQIRSTAGGGNWSDGATWVGGVVPGAGSQVVIDGLVRVDGSPTVAGLTITSRGTLQSVSWHRTLTVNGSVVNDGTLRDDDSGWNLLLRATGDLTNNGAWGNEATYLDGTTTQRLTLGNGDVWNSPLFDTDAGSRILASTPQTFAKDVHLDGATLDMGSRALTLREGGRLLNGTVLLDGTLTVDPGAQLGSQTRLVGNILAAGDVTVAGDGMVFQGTLTVAGILHAESWHRSMTVEGNVVNDGTIRDSDNGWDLHLSVTGNLTNNGTWQNFKTYLTGAGNQQLVLGAGRTWASPIDVDKPAGSVVAATAQTFTQQVLLRSSTLDMQQYTLTLDGAGHLQDGTVRLNGILRGVNDAAIGRNVRYIGNITLQDLVQVADNSNVFQGTLTVAGTLQVRSWHYTLVVEGNVVNQGIIQDSPSGWDLHLKVTGNLTNDGTWRNYLTYLSGTGDQQLALGTNDVWENPILHENDEGRAVATTPQTFTQPFNLNQSELVMAGHTLTLSGAGHFVDGTVRLNGDFRGVANAEIGRNVRFVGNFSIRDAIQIGDSGLTFEGTITVVDTLRARDWHNHLTVEGNVINQGVISDSPSGWDLHLHVTGNVTNDGKWINYWTYLEEGGNHQLAQGAENMFEGPISIDDTLGTTVAVTPLTFANQVFLNGRILDMQNHALTLFGGGYLHDGTVLLRGELHGQGGSQLGYNTRIVGDVSIRDLIQIAGENNVFEGHLTVVDTLQAASWHHTTTVEGDVTNVGVIRDAPSGWDLHLHVMGDVTDYGVWQNYRTYLDGVGRRTVWAPSMQSELYASGEQVILTGTNVMPALHMMGEGICMVDAESSLLMTGDNPSNDMINHGEIIGQQEVSSGGTFNYYRASARVAAGGATDTLRVHHFGNQVPDTYGNAVRAWWRLETTDTFLTTLEYLELEYGDDQLGINSEGSLQLYHSDDGGLTWRQVSTGANVERYPDQNRLRVANVPATGDYVLSSYPDPVSVRPALIFSVVGRTQIRVGPPNRYDVHYANNSDVSTGDFMIQLQTQGGVYIDHVEPSMPVGVGAQHIPVDSLTFDGNREEAILWVRSMGPREERTFSVILNAEPDAGKVYSPDDTEILPLLAVGAIWIGKALVVGYVSNVAVNMAEEVWRPVAPCETVSGAMWEAFKASVSRTNDKWFGWEQPAKTIADGVQGEMLQRVGVRIPPKDVVDGMGNFFVRGPQRYLEGKFKVKDCGGSEKTVTVETGQGDRNFQKVTSWDPNEKVGPAGVGDQGFMSAAGRMTYQILFENKREATAPAWKIVVEDVLSDAFDPSTVVFENSSHAGWDFTVDGNVLRWEIEGIELVPNVNPPEGEGFVTFSVKPYDHLASGTALRNEATIVFDLNPPITTNEVVNTLDYEAPVTTMMPLPAVTNTRDLVVHWQRSDGPGGSGAFSTTVFASSDGGAFEAVGSSTTDSLVVDLPPGHTYTFYGLSRDLVGNAELVRPEMVTTQFAGSVDVEDQADLPYRFALAPAYPNPFNPATTIRFSVPIHERTTLQVFDALGRRVAVLYEGMATPGEHQVQWNAGHVASGVYFYRLQQGKRTEIRSMVLMK